MAIIWLIIILLVVNKEAESSGLPPGADGFTTPPAYSRPLNKNSGLFNKPKPQNPGPDKPGKNGGSSGDDDNSKSDLNFKPECSNPNTRYHYWHELMHQSDSDSNTESESNWSEDSDWQGSSDCEDSDWQENFLKTLYVTVSDGRVIKLEKQQLRDKAHHLDVFPNIKIPKTFDIKYVKTLDYKSRLKYVRDRSKLPEKTIYDMQMEASKFFRSTQTKPFSGCLGRRKIAGTLYINERTKTVAFVNKSDSKCRTIIKMTKPQLDRLKDRNYHLFPNV